MSTDPTKTIRDNDFIFENTPIRIVANRNSPKIELPGIEVGPFIEGKEYEVRYWIATELKKAGVARIRMDESLDLMMLNKIQWKERVQASQKLTSLPKDFYPKLRRYLKELNEASIKKPEKRRDSEKAKKLSDDITRTRLKKIVSLASSPQTRQTMGNLTKEERVLYNYLHENISKFRAEILETQGEDRA